MNDPKPKKPTPTQLAILRNVEAGRTLDHGRDPTQSASAGWSCSITSCLRAGWLTYPAYHLTDLGRAALAL